MVGQVKSCDHKWIKVDVYVNKKLVFPIVKGYFYCEKCLETKTLRW